MPSMTYGNHSCDAVFAMIGPAIGKAPLPRIRAGIFAR
jgi:hypothetical protein